MRSRLRGRAIATVITGVVTVAVTGSPLGGLGALETMLLLMEGEDKLGARLAESAQEQLPMMRDAAVVDYVNNMGQELARVSGRDDFEYEFFVVEDPELNAFALPGGKVFINTGAILATDSEAELAGLVAHELAHAVLSHGLQRVTQANLFANIGRFIPFGGVLTNIAILDYSRVQERQADFLGTRILAASGYAADGLRNLMVTLNDRSGDDGGDFAWLSTHPATDDRVRYLESLILDNGYNRYAYEGVEKHAQIQARIINLTDDTGAKLRKDGAALMPEETAMEVPESETTPENAPETPSPTP
ncbi:MAG: M48 family metalloprotease [Coleofasciculaceae cyanobacterium SM2_3_26]|nr:M48 family metalloprotease [Coleofasciculaceae cyanobacterium SM2_3_26]